MLRDQSWFVGAALLASLAFPPSVAETPLVLLAQAKKPEAGKVFDDWVINCENQSDASQKCFATQFQYASQSGQRILSPHQIAELTKVYSLNVGFLGPKGEAQIIVYLPLNIDLAAGVSLKLDPGPSVPLSVVACEQIGCRATATLDAATQKALTDAKGFAINIVPYVILGDRPPATALLGSVRGLSAALASLK